eukprot:CAMPEP_0202972216 /NCGR_PEP_ID=MMETSP1396-20130829/34450_1 /ASSEMBLY_ACC=CAM_ASM_000872 /TAXON_ID= /ORGANISM="Pseudokeronopsis sp., Strain Brazil" /LENGTH=119 /DNA_ID=CAMNT_0049702391 /DNA_START=389 /DNA_END=748 /DNA_ORIENTATION=+
MCLWERYRLLKKKSISSPARGTKCPQPHKHVPERPIPISEVVLGLVVEVFFEEGEEEDVGGDGGGEGQGVEEDAVLPSGDCSFSGTGSPLRLNLRSTTYLPDETNRNPSAKTTKINAHM